MIQPLQREHAAAISDFWRTFAPEKYWIDSKICESHMFGSPIFDWGASFVSLHDGKVNGFVSAKRSAGGSLYKGPDPEQFHIQAIAFDTPSIGCDLLAEAIKVISARGCRDLVFGQDNLHIFPGCPQDFPALHSFLVIAGFEKKGEAYDLESPNLQDYTPPEVVAEVNPDAVFRRCSAADLDLVSAFFQKEFPLRWNYDVHEKMKAEGPETVVGLFFEGACHGFALIQDYRSCDLPLGGAVWQHDLGPRWGSLGPIGVSESVRGHRFGHAILSAGLMELKAAGVEKCIIDWTTLFQYYGRHGFTTNRTYDLMKLEL